MRRIVTGEQIAQLTNPDPFAVPCGGPRSTGPRAGSSPSCSSPGWSGWLVRLIVRHPVTAAVLAVLVLVWLHAGWPGLVALVLIVVVVLAAWRWAWPVSFARWIAGPARGKWRAWFYRRRWAAVMTIGGLAPFYQGRILLPVLGKVTATRYTDRVAVRLVSGQSAGRLRRPGRQPGARVRRDAVPGPHRPLRARWCWSSSAATPWPSSSRPCPSRPTRTCGRCRSAAARTACRGWSGCTARTC